MEFVHNGGNWVTFIFEQLKGNKGNHYGCNYNITLNNNNLKTYKK